MTRSSYEYDNQYSVSHKSMGKKPLTQPLIEHEEAAYGAVLNESSACASADMSLVTLASEQEEETVVRSRPGVHGSAVA